MNQQVCHSFVTDASIKPTGRQCRRCLAGRLGCPANCWLARTRRVPSLKSHSRLYDGLIGNQDPKRRRPEIGEIVEALGPGIIGIAFVILLALALWGCHSGTP